MKRTSTIMDAPQMSFTTAVPSTRTITRVQPSAASAGTFFWFLVSPWTKRTTAGRERWFTDPHNLVAVGGRRVRL